jgi:membrane-bound lytic murein transglycosylase A
MEDRKPETGTRKLVNLPVLHFRFSVSCFAFSFLLRFSFAEFGWRPRVVVLLASVLTACAHVPPAVPSAPSPAPRLAALDPAECRAILHDDTSAESLQQAAARSLDSMQNPSAPEMRLVDRPMSVADLKSVLQAVADAGNDANRSDQLCDRLRLYRVELPAPLLVTGYYQPELAASRTRTERFRYPLYCTPDDLVDVNLGEFCPACRGKVAQGRVKNGALVPYYSRAQIDGGALEGRGYELAWLDDPIEAFFLHVQGSALLHFDDGVAMQISYSGSNGWPYTSIGRVLIEQGALARETVSLQTLKDYLRSHPDEQAAVMAANQRYIFFRPVAAGPIGSTGIVLTAGRSIAADKAIYPPGALAFLRILPRDASSAIHYQPEVSRVVLVQDTGTAITGPNRIDVFWGTGATAEDIAGGMRNPGELYLLLPQ